jgi:hypothetical protein
VTKRNKIRLAIVCLLLVAIVILSPRLFDWITRERSWVTRDLLVEGKQVKVSTEYSETRLFGDPRSFSIGGGNWRYRTIISIEGVLFADVTSTASPWALWYVDGQWYLAGHKLLPDEWHILRLDGGNRTTRVQRTSLPRMNRPWNLVEIDQAAGCQGIFDNPRTPG